MRNFYLLSLTENNVKLFQVDHDSLEEINLTNIPSSLEESMGAKSIEKQLQSHHGSNASETIYHGHTGDTDFHTNNLMTFLRKVNQGVSEYLKDKGEPLMIAAVDKTFARYKQINTYPYLLTDRFLHGNYDRTNNKDLQQKAWEACLYQIV